jgi:hypothetical protein
MKGEQIIETTITTITALADTAFSLELLAAMGVLAEGQFPKALIRKYLRKEQLMASELLMELYGDMLEEQLVKHEKQWTMQLTEQFTEQLTEQLEKKEEEIAANMLREGIAPDVTVKVTGLSLDKISALKFKLAQ